MLSAASFLACLALLVLAYKGFDLECRDLLFDWTVAKIYSVKCFSLRKGFFPEYFSRYAVYKNSEWVVHQ